MSHYTITFNTKPEICIFFTELEILFLQSQTFLVFLDVTKGTR